MVFSGLWNLFIIMFLALSESFLAFEFIKESLKTQDVKSFLLPF